MVEGFKLAGQGQDFFSQLCSPARDANSSGSNSNQRNNDTSLGASAGIGTDISAEVRATAGIRSGMFRPQPTPYSTFSSYEHGLHIANAGIPQYTFAATPLLDQFGGGHVEGRMGRMGRMGRSDAGVVGGMGGGGMMGGSGGPLNTGGFAAAPPGGFHASASASASNGPTSLGVGVGVQELGSSVVATSNSDHSAGYSSSSPASSIQPSDLYSSIPIAVPMPHLPQLQCHQNQPPSQQQQQHQHHQQHQPHLPHPQQQQQQQHQHQLPRQRIPQRNHYKMDQQSDLDPNDITQQEAAARDFEPHLEGPLVGEKLSSHAITEEYARADPIYVAKTLTLPQTYSHYRPILGDGNCGWRAIAFGYFETLVQCGNIDTVRSELQRMTGLNKYIEEVGGHDASMLELMVDETFALYNDIILAMTEGGDPLPNLIAKFNDSSISQCLVYHLRLLAGARLNGNRAQYETFIASSVERYLETTVMPVNREIDHICLSLVYEILLEPANMILEIAYLDRSEGDKVNVHRFPAEGTGQDPSPLAPAIHLLYRPGHYDILYRETRAPLPGAPVDIQVHRVNSFTHHNRDFENPVVALQDTYTMDLSPLLLIPGLSSSSLSSLSPYGAPSTSQSPMVDPYAPSPGSAWAPQPLNSEVLSAPIADQPSPPQQQAMVRFSKWNFPNLPEVAAENNSTYEPAYVTNTFKNSHYNTAHYNNTHFQPEMYQPGAEDESWSSGNGKTGGRKRSTDHCTGIKKEK